MRRSPLGSLAASPTMVGAVTVLIAIVAVFLAYNANSGLPFVPVYRVSVEVPNAARVINNNEVRIGGHRVGVVESIDPVAETESRAGEGDGGAVARLNLKLDKSAGPLPMDSVFRVRYRSAFGLKYLEIIRGVGDPAPEAHSFIGTDDETVCQLPVNPATFASQLSDSARNGCFQEQTEFDDIGNTFDAPTRENVRANLDGYGDGFAARGTSLNDAVASLEPLFRGLRPVAETLTAPDTRLRRLFPELGDAARIVAPVAVEQAELFGYAARAFAAISSDTAALQETISEGVPTLETGIEVLPEQRLFLRDFAALSRELRPGVADLRTTLPVLNEAIEVGTPVLARSPAMNQRLEAALLELDRLVAQPTTRISLQRLGDTFDVAAPLSKYVVPAQTVCNYFNYYFTYFAESFSQETTTGYSYRQSATGAPLPFEAEASVGAYSGRTASGRANSALGNTFEPFDIPIANAGPYMPAGQHDADCQLGQRGYPLGAAPLPGQPANIAANLVSDLPGSRGPTTVFWNADQQREFVDTRVDSRQPETWKGAGK